MRLLVGFRVHRWFGVCLWLNVRKFDFVSVLSCAMEFAYSSIIRLFTVKQSYITHLISSTFTKKYYSIIYDFPIHSQEIRLMYFITIFACIILNMESAFIYLGN